MGMNLLFFVLRTIDLKTIKARYLVSLAILRTPLQVLNEYVFISSLSLLCSLIFAVISLFVIVTFFPQSPEFFFAGFADFLATFFADFFATNLSILLSFLFFEFLESSSADSLAVFCPISFLAFSL